MIRKKCAAVAVLSKDIALLTLL